MIIPTSRNDYAAGFADGYRQGKKDAERKKGRWKEIEFISDAYDIHGAKTWACRAQCDSCGIIMTWVEGHYSQYHYCPSCGARMS